MLIKFVRNSFHFQIYKLHRQFQTGSKNAFCAYEEYGDVVLQHVDLIYERKTKSECEDICDKLTIFHCRGFSLKPAQYSFTCLIHSEDSKIYGPRLLEETRKGFYYEKAKCLNGKYQTEFIKYELSK